jgi:hypothetical protein
MAKVPLRTTLGLVPSNAPLSAEESFILFPPLAPLTTSTRFTFISIPQTFIIATICFYGSHLMVLHFLLNPRTINAPKKSATISSVLENVPLRDCLKPLNRETSHWQPLDSKPLVFALSPHSLPALTRSITARQPVTCY